MFVDELQYVDVAAEPEALEKIIQQTRGYPYFLQEWGKHAWDVAKSWLRFFRQADKWNDCYIFPQ